MNSEDATTEREFEQDEQAEQAEPVKLAQAPAPRAETPVGDHIAAPNGAGRQPVAQAARHLIHFDESLSGVYFPNEMKYTLRDEVMGQVRSRVVAFDAVTKVQLTERNVVYDYYLNPDDSEKVGISAQGEPYTAVMGRYAKSEFVRICGFGPDQAVIDALVNNEEILYLTVVGTPMYSSAVRGAQLRMSNPRDVALIQGQKSIKVAELEAFYKDGTKEKLISLPNATLMGGSNTGNGQRANPRNVNLDQI